MGYHSIPYDRRIRENIKNYSFSHLYDMDTVREYLQSLADVLEINILLTARHGEKEIVIGDSFLGFYPDVVNDPGRKIKVQDGEKVAGQVIEFLVDQLYIEPSGDGGYRLKK